MLLVAFCTLLLAATQLLMKHGLRTEAILLIIVGFLLQLIAGVLVTISLKHGNLSVLYPIIALGFVWVTLAGVVILGEVLLSRQIAGIVIIIAGVSLIGHRGRR